ncbi:MAG TPA: RNA polymerase sigma factor [Kofleriaceae bacterium]|nr:RNA polymerase sigma factor [Kofleriaceae bacterium]
MILTRSLPACQPADGSADPVQHVSGKATTLHTVLEDAAPVLTRIAQRLCGSTADAHDLLQDTIERAIRQGLPADVQNPRAWLATIMHNLFVDRCRAASRAPVHEPLEEVHDRYHDITPLSVDSPEPAWRHLTIEDVRAALDAIDRPFREVYVMHTFERRPYEEIAAQLKISRVTVGTRLTRTRKLLRKELVKRFGRGTKP